MPHNCLVECSLMDTIGGKFYDYLVTFVQNQHVLERSVLYKKESNFFLFREDYFTEWRHSNFDRDTSPESVYFPNK